MNSSSNQHRSASKGSGNNSSGHKSTSGSDITTESGTSTNASSSEFSCDTVVYRGASGSGYSDGSGTDGEHPPMFSMRSASSSREGSIRGSLDEIPRPASAGNRRRKILTNGAISPRQCLSPSPRSPAGRAMSDCGGSRKHTLPAIPEVVAGDKMPLSGLVPIQSNHRYRQLCHINNLRQKQKSQNNEVINIQKEREKNMPAKKSEEIWIDCDPSNQAHSDVQSSKSNPQKSKIPLPTSKKRASYGYMDSQKAQMINSWVENQTGPIDNNCGSRNQAEGSEEKCALKTDTSKTIFQSDVSNLSPDTINEQPVFRALTQFRTIDTSDDGGGSSIKSLENTDQIKVQIHHTQQPMTTGGESPASMSYLECDITNLGETVSCKPTPPPPPPRKTSPRTFNNETSDKEGDVKQTSDTTLGKFLYSKDTEGETMEVNGNADDSRTFENKNLVYKDMYTYKNSTNGELRNIKTRTKKPDGKCFLPNEQRNSLHEHQMEDSHPLRILSESNLTVVSSFGGSLNDLDIEECENREDIAEKLSFFTVPDMPHSNSHNMDIFDDSVIGQRFKEFERLHRQQNTAPLHLSENINDAARNPTTSKPILSTFASRNIENSNQKIVPLGEYVSLNDTCESAVSNLYLSLIHI